MNYKSQLFYAFLSVLILSIGYFTYRNYVNSNDINSLHPIVSIPSKQLVTNYISNESKSDSIYTDKIIEVYGSIERITDLNNRKTIILEGDNTLNSGIICDVSESEYKKLANLKKHQKLRVKGRCKGFLKDVILLNCYLDTRKTNE